MPDAGVGTVRRWIVNLGLQNGLGVRLKDATRVGDLRRPNLVNPRSASFSRHLRGSATPDCGTATLSEYRRTGKICMGVRKTPVRQARPYLNKGN